MQRRELEPRLGVRYKVANDFFKVRCSESEVTQHLTFRRKVRGHLPGQRFGAMQGRPYRNNQRAPIAWQ